MTELEEKIFNRFPEGHTAHIPLHLIYYYHVRTSDAYDICFDDVDLTRGYWKTLKLMPETVKLLKRQKNRILTSATTIPGYEVTGLFVVDPLTGKPISSYQLGYISKVIRREIDPNWRTYNGNPFRTKFTSLDEK